MGGLWTQKLKGAAKATLRNIGGLTRRVAKRPIILVFHSVAERMIDPRVQVIHTLARPFEAMMRFLHENHSVARLDEVVKDMERGARLPSDLVVLTFDDGYRNNLTLVEPMLRSLGLPFCVYVSSRQITEGGRFPTYTARVAIF